LCESICVSRESVHCHDLHFIRPVMGKQPIHFPHDIHRHALAAPLLALHQHALSVAAQNQVDATVRSAQARLFDAVALAAECFAHHLLKLTPPQRRHALQTGERIE